jgi:hypothetical protein
MTHTHTNYDYGGRFCWRPIGGNAHKSVLALIRRRNSASFPLSLIMTK